MVTGDYLTERESLIGHIKGTDKIQRVLVGKLVRERERDIHISYSYQIICKI
jgi:hypothetical protein